MEVEPGDGRVRLEESLELMIISAHMVIDGRESALISIVVQPHWLQQKKMFKLKEKAEQSSDYSRVGLVN